MLKHWHRLKGSNPIVLFHSEQKNKTWSKFFCRKLKLLLVRVKKETNNGEGMNQNPSSTPCGIPRPGAERGRGGCVWARLGMRKGNQGLTDMLRIWKTWTRPTRLIENSKGTNFSGTDPHHKGLHQTFSPILFSTPNRVHSLKKDASTPLSPICSIQSGLAEYSAFPCGPHWLDLKNKRPLKYSIITQISFVNSEQWIKKPININLLIR